MAAVVGLGMAAAMIVACQKEAPLGGSSTAYEVAGVVKSAPNALFQMSNGTGVKSFNVQTGCNGCYGIIQNTTSSSTNTMGLMGQNANYILVDGYTDPQCMNTLYCKLNKALPNSPIYYIIPNQGPAMGTRKILQLQVIAGAPAIPSWTNAPFVYNVTNNTWTVEAVTNTYFHTTVVTALPASTCCFPC